ncbi:MAG: ATP-binding protein [Robiginitomaculum sp.]|nr:ATP-binding protein [Robiginitomaculum sp.]
MEQTQHYIFPAKTGLSSFRDSGYRDTSMAVAELIDNSIQAKAETIRLLAFEKIEQGRVNKQSSLYKIAVFDDGEGMPKSVLELCLGFAQGTRLNKRDGIGRFGVGLPLASISQCKRVTVYSWQDGNRPLMTYMDIDEVLEQDQNFTNGTIEKDIPKQYTDALGNLIGKSGTLVVWDKCDRVNIKKTQTLLRHMQTGFCRIYRHLLDDNDSYGIKRDIKLLKINDEETVEFSLTANDPLYLLTPNNLPGFESKATNESYQKIIKEKIEYAPGVFSEIEIHASYIKTNPGRWKNGSEQAKHYKRNTGISFVRAEREIDFGCFGYYNPTELTERYWGIEVRFMPDLDEFFGVTNNKQAVRGINYLDKEELEDYDDEYIENDLHLKFRNKLSQYIKNLHDQLKKEVNNRATAPYDPDRDVNAPSLPAAEEAESASESLQNDNTPTGTQRSAKKKTEQEKEDEIRSVIKAANPNLSDEEVLIAVKAFKKLKLAISFEGWYGEQFLTVKGVGQTCTAIINKQHPFYTDLYQGICGGENTPVAQAMNLLLMAYARAEDELYNEKDTLEKFRSKWGAHVRTFLNDLKTH